MFYANLPLFFLAPPSPHFCSLGLKMQFHFAIALAVLVAPTWSRRAMAEYAKRPLCFMITFGLAHLSL